MAEGGYPSGMNSLESIMQDLTECSICFSVFCEPKMLSCQHVFCTACLEQWRVSNNSRVAISCPTCRKETGIQESGVSGLPLAHQAHRLIEEMANQHRSQLQKRLDEVYSNLVGVMNRNQTSLHQIFRDIDSHLKQSVEQLTEKADQLKKDAEEKWRPGEDQPSVSSEGLSYRLRTLADDLEEVLKGPSSGIITRHKGLLDRTEPLNDAMSFLQEPIPECTDVTLKFHPSTSELSIGRLEVVHSEPSAPSYQDLEIQDLEPQDLEPGYPELQEPEPQEVESELQEALQPLHQQKPVPSKPRLIQELDFSGNMAFDPEGNLLCLRKDGTGSLISASNGSIIETYTTSITNNIDSIAISDSKLAVVQSQIVAPTLTLFNRSGNDIDFANEQLMGNLNSPLKCIFTSKDCLLVCEKSPPSISMFNNRQVLIKRFEIDFTPSYIAIDDDDSFYVCDNANRSIHHFKANCRAANVLQCSHENGESFWPKGIAIDRVNRRLFVCGYHSSKILQLSGDCFVMWLNKVDGVFWPQDIALNKSGQAAIYCDVYPGKTLLYDLN